ncbi:ATP-binding protein [Bacillus sp. 2205SS5-2]|uniref:ATP-binding protein n=1 Tax=Bacillus sp. 2205SS5-2 TaxID=3109031 RepID=UPI0030053921
MNNLTILEAVVEKDSVNYEAWYLLGKEYIKNNRLKEGLHAFSLALSLENDEMKALVQQSLASYLSSSEETVFSMEEEKALDASKEDSLKRESSKLEVIKGNKPAKVLPFVEKKPKPVTFEDVGGLEALKKTIEMKIIKPFVNPGLFSKFKKKSGGGILLFGPPGCGKTFIAKATAGEIGANFYPVHITDILDPYFGASEQNLHQMFETARANRPSVLFFDEVDTIGYSRSKSTSDTMRPLVDSMLTEMESVDTNTDKLLVIGATNMPWDVDAAFKRPGRFDKLVFVPPPDKEARKQIFALKLDGKPVEEALQLELLAAKTENYSGADIDNVIETAIESVLNEIMDTNEERHISMHDLLQAIEETTPSTLEWMNTIKNYIKYSNQSGLYSDVAKYLK